MVVEMESEGITSSVANESDALEMDCSFSSLVGSGWMRFGVAFGPSTSKSTRSRPD